MALSPLSFRKLYCRCMGLLYLAAFTSLLVQYKGLFGFDGIQPVSAFLQQVEASSSLRPDASAWSKLSTLPTLAWFTSELEVDVDTLMQGVIIMGSALASVAAIGYGNMILFAVSSM